MCGTSVNGPLKICNPHNLESTVTALNHATLEGPGASRASTVQTFPPTVIPSPSVQVKSVLVTKSGIADAIFWTVIACDDFILAIASTAVAFTAVVVAVVVVLVLVGGTTEKASAPKEANNRPKIAIRTNMFLPFS
jgi:hypothetical protein